jgi:hypothetical protein
MASSGGTAARAQGRVSWRRFTAILLPSLAVVALLVILTSQAVLAVSFSISGTPFTVTAKTLNGQGFEQFGVLDTSVNNSLPGNTNQIVLAEDAIRYATLTDLCQQLILGGLTATIKAGYGGSQVTATDLVVDTDHLHGGFAKFTNIEIGRDSSTLNQVPGIRGRVGDFGIQADTVFISDLRQHAYASTAGTFTLPGFTLAFGGHC